MTDKTPDHPEPRRKISPEALARFLEALSPDMEAAGHLYLRLHKKLINFFRMKGVSDPESAADETIDLAAVKILAGQVVPNVEKIGRAHV